MNLFAAANVDLPSARKGGPPAKHSMRTLRVPLLNHRVVEEAARLAAFSPTPSQLKIASDYAKAAGSAKFAKQQETAVRNRFYADVLGALLGYRQYDPDQPYSLAFERPIRRGKVDAALGRFPGINGADELIAPCEMKGPDTADLDAVMPGRGRSPVQQAWDYAIDSPGARWVLVSNCVELRLYAFGSGRDAYETFDLRRLDEEDEHRRLWLLLSADRFLRGETDKLLARTADAYKDITNKLYVEYRGLRDRLIQYLVDAAGGPRLAPLDAIEVAQKLLDRVLFIAFAQRTDLLQDRLLQRAAKERSDFDPKPLWTNFRNLFGFLDIGNHRLDIEAYNGGLFAPDPVADALTLPDELAVDLAGLGDWDYRSDVPVTVLGHIFEQSITDLEARRAESRGEAPPVISKRKRDGVVYTPDIVTRFLIERTLGKTLAERFATLLKTHAGVGGPSETGDIPWPDEDAERAFWSDYLGELRRLTIVDPACGSGAFLVAAFDALAADYRRAAGRLEELGEPVDFDVFDEIVTKNLFGVDINAESVEITRLSLWLKTARRKHKLQNLEATIKVGDSLIDDPAFTARPFDWRSAFPRVFEEGGFDVVIGNPPYVRMELLKPVKPHLEKHYVVAADRTDLYAYFFERGVGLLKPGGRLGYISSSTFFRTGSGENLRTFLGDGVAVEAVVDFGDLQLFEGVTTYPAILTLKREAAPDGALAFLKIDKALPKDLTAAFDEGSRAMPRVRLGRGSWTFEDDALARLRAKIADGRSTLGEVYGPPMRGVVTGLNDAFVVDRATRERLVAADPKSAELLKPFLRGENVKRWRIESEDLFLINTPKGKVDIDDYPAVRDWLLPFRPALEKRATKQEWFELQQAQLAYQPHFLAAKVVYAHFASDRGFAFDEEGFFSNDKSYFIPNALPALAALLNSKVIWLCAKAISPAVRGGFHELRVQYMETLPIPVTPVKIEQAMSAQSRRCSDSASERFRVQTAVRRRILDLAPPKARLSQKLEAWHLLDFAAFRAEIRRVFKMEIPLKERGDWEAYLAESRAEVLRLTAEIEAAEREIDAIVYRLFDLDDAEIALLEASLAGQY